MTKPIILWSSTHIIPDALYTIFFLVLGVFVTYCCVTNDPQCNGSKQQALIISQHLGAGFLIQLPG